MFGALLHLINNGLTKGVLFLSAGNIHRAYGSKSTDDVTGALRRVAALRRRCSWPGSSRSPARRRSARSSASSPSSMPRFRSGQFAVAVLFLLLLVVVFIGMGATVLAVVQGEPRPAARQAASRATARSRSPRASACSRWCCCWASTSRRRWTHCCARRRRSWNPNDRATERACA